MGQLGKGVYLSNYGTAQNVTVKEATIAGDVLFAIGCSQVDAGLTTLNLTKPAGWTIDPAFAGAAGGGYSALYPSGGSNFLEGAYAQPGAQPANTVYAFTTQVAAHVVVLLFRCNEQILAIPSVTAGAFGDYQAAGPAVLAMNTPISNPGFHFYAINGQGENTPLVYRAPTGDPQALCQVCHLSNLLGDAINLDLWVAAIARNTAWAGNVTFTYTPALDGWVAGGGNIQLGATNTPSTLAFPLCLPGQKKAAINRLRGGSSSGGGAGGIGGLSGLGAPPDAATSVKRILFRSGKL